MGVPHDNPIQRLPERYAYNVLEKQVSTLIERRKLDYTDCTFLATEYVYPFVNKFATLLGLEGKDSYSVSNIRDGYYQYLQFWLSYEMRGILREHAVGEVHVHLDGYVETKSTQHYEAAHEAARERMEELESDPPRHNIHGDNFEQGILEAMIDVLAESSVDKIENAYIIRDRPEDDWDDANNILDFYSDEAILHNIKTYYANYAREYGTLVSHNFPTIEEEISNTRTNFLLVVVKLDNIRREWGEKKGWSISWYWLESDEESLRFEFHREDEEEVANVVNPWKDNVLNYEGENYETFYGGSSGDMLLFDLDRDQRLVFGEVHDELGSKLNSYLRERGVRLWHPARED